MREIKFRAWDNDNERFLDGYELSIDIDREGSVFFSDNTPPFNKYGKVTLMQFTGLLDKNGVEIYEGDIVRRKYWSWGLDRELEVEVSYGNLFWAGYEDHGSGIGFNLELEQEHKIGDRLEEYEVIGNIYENPGLLKESK